LAIKRDLYRYDYAYPPGVAVAASLPPGEEFSACFAAHIVAIQMKTFENGLASDALREDSKSNRRLAFLSTAARALLSPADLGAVMGAQLTTSARMMRDDRPRTVLGYNELYATIERPSIASQYQDDFAFAWQRIAGANPMVLRALSAQPDNYRFNQTHFAAAARAHYGASYNGPSFDHALAAGRLFVADYSLLADVPSGSWMGVPQYLFAPIALFCWFPPIGRHPARLMPIAIQESQRGDAPVVGPVDPAAWILAKTAVQVADLSWHEARAHLGLTHLVMEGVTLATERQLSERHPLFALLTPHCAFTLAINDFAKHHLIVPGGQVEQYIAPAIEGFLGVVVKTLDGFNWKDVALKRDLQARGLDDVSRLPLYPYRDDALGIWDAIERFVTEYVGLYYRDADAVRDDTELRAWALELAAQDGARLRSVTPPETREELVDLLTFFIFTASAQHSALNYTQWPYMGYVPSMPAAAYRPLPADARSQRVADFDREYLEMLPTYTQASGQINLLYLLSGIRYNHLGDYPLCHFHDLRVVPVLRRFKERLDKVETDSQGRDQSRPISYPYLFPSNVAQSVHI
jgi:arachidonate 15-lipoxygenase